MNGDEGYNIAARYRTVRKHLDSLGYKQALSLDALPLIENLLADLIQTTESLKHFKTIAQENSQACSQLQLAVDPYKCDNARLVQECDQLHLDLIEVKDSYQKQIRDLKKLVYKLECECNDLQLSSSRNLHRIKELEVESAKKSKKILELQGKCLKPTISNVTLAARQRPCFPLRRPVLDSEPMVRAGPSSTSLPVLSTPEPKVLDLLTMADHRMSSLSHEITKLKGELSTQTDNVHVLKGQLSTKEKELFRLKKLLEGGRPYVAVCKDCGCQKSNQNLAVRDDATQKELYTMQQEKLELEQQLKEALNKQHDAMSQALKLAERNEELEKELRDIDHIALAVEADCNSAVKENNKRVSKIQEKLDEAITQIRVLEGELNVERKEVQELRADLETCRLEKRNIQRTVETTLDEKKKLTDKINELTVIEKSLSNEIDRLAKENESQRHDIVELQCSNRALKEQLYSKSSLKSCSGQDLSHSKEKGDKNDHNTASKSHRDIHSPSISGNNSSQSNDMLQERDFLKRLNEKETQISLLQDSVAHLKKEKDYYRSEYNNLKDTQKRLTDDSNSELWIRIRDLNRQLIEKENALDDLQREKRDLIREKSNLETRLEICRCDHRQPYRFCTGCKHGSCTCTASFGSIGTEGVSKAMIDRLEHERDIARTDIERLIQERDVLRERLQLATETHTSEQRRMRDSLLDLESRLKHIEKEKQDLVLTQGTRRATINGLEDQLDDMREELRRTKQELATQRTQYIQIRALQDQTDQALGDVQSQLAQSESELIKATDRNRAMERQQLQLDNQVKELKQEINTLRTKMNHLDHEKDQLLMVLDEKTERIANLEREIMSKDQQTMGMQQQIRDAQHKHDICIDQSAEQERQLRSMQLEIENLQRQLEAASTERENAIQENRRLQDDLAAVTCEVRNLQRELEVSRAEAYDLKKQLQTYVSEVRRAEDLLNRKESERTEMLNHFRSLSMEATVLENNNHSLESEAAEARGALHNARDRVLDLERQLADRDSLIRGYETQISELTQTVASMETQLRQQSEQRHRTEADLKAVRDLCMKMDQQKDALMEQLGDRDSLKAQYDSQIARLKAEQNIIQDQMNRDRAAVERLETLLDQARQESINAQATNQELQSEVSRLKQKISELQSKLAAESAELRQYQNQAAEYSKQISELRRQVTNERFDRARKEEESRRRMSKDTVDKSIQKEPTQDPKKSRTSDSRLPSQWNGTSSFRYFQKEEPEEYNVAEENQRKLADRSETPGKSKEHSFNYYQDKPQAFGQTSRAPRPCTCPPKRKKQEIKATNSDISNIGKPLFESTGIYEKDNNYKSINLENTSTSPHGKVKSEIQTRSKEEDTKEEDAKEEEAKKEYAKKEYAKSAEGLNLIIEGKPETDQEDSPLRSEGRREETYAANMQTTKRIESISPENVKESLHSAGTKVIKDEVNNRTKIDCAKLCRRNVCVENRYNYQKQGYSMREYIKRECIRSKNEEINVRDLSDKSAYRRRDYSANRLQTPIVDTDVTSILLKYLPSINPRISNVKDVYPASDRSRKQAEKKIDSSRHDEMITKQSNNKEAETIPKIVTRESRCRVPCAHKVNYIINCPGMSGKKCSEFYMKDENSAQYSNSANIRHQTTMTELRAEMIATIEFAQPDLVKTLGEIKEYTKNLKEQLIIMNKNMGTNLMIDDNLNAIIEKKKEFSVQEEHTQREGKHERQKDVNTQEPDKKNVYV